MPSPMERFQAKVEVDPTTGCHLWTGAQSWGYGAFWVDGRVLRAHRYALATHLGRPLAPGHEACHTCDTSLCVNPSHLYEGTRQQNVDDCTARERQAWGMRHGHHVLSDSQVRGIRSLAQAGVATREIARQYGVNQSTVYRIARRQRWQMLDAQAS